MPRRWVVTILFGIWAVAFWLSLHGGLALLIDRKTGAKYCVQRLALYLDLDQQSPVAGVITGASGLLTVALPLLIVAIIVVPYVSRWRARVRAAP
jgi:hypothetical protein